mmetsp:Transcript_9536/g.13410  ORF Transcript_9536/g.13410 Transcript_9536/m.13410 type:complete len:241 (+) Transcript_9536:256-978(+)
MLIYQQHGPQQVVVAAPLCQACWWWRNPSSSPCHNYCPLIHHAVVPWQLLPMPAVQPKQWLASTTGCRISWSTLSTSKIEIPEKSSLSGAYGPSSWLPMPMPSCWLKSQSNRAPSHRTERWLRHMRPWTAAGLKVRTSRPMYSSSSPRRCRKSAKRLMGMLEIVNSPLNSMPKCSMSSSRYFSSRAAWGGGRKAPSGLYTRSRCSPVPSRPYPSSFSFRRPATLRSKTPLPRCRFTFLAL